MMSRTPSATLHRSESQAMPMQGLTLLWSVDIRGDPCSLATRLGTSQVPVHVHSCRQGMKLSRDTSRKNLCLRSSYLTLSDAVRLIMLLRVTILHPVRLQRRRKASKATLAPGFGQAMTRNAAILQSECRRQAWQNFIQPVPARIAWTRSPKFDTAWLEANILWQQSFAHSLLDMHCFDRELRR